MKCCVTECVWLRESHVSNQWSVVLQNVYGSVNHMYTEHQVDIHEFLASWGEVVDAYTIKGKKKM